MPTEFIEIGLNNAEKEAILKYAGFFIMNTETREDLANKRKKWIRFKPGTLKDVIGELAYHFNRTKDDATFHFLDELIVHLEYYERSLS